MSLLLTEEERALQSRVEDLADRELAPRAQESEHKAAFSWENWRAIVELGLAGLGVDPKYGGSGGGYRQLAIAVEGVARGDASASVSLVAHSSLATQTILQFGDESQKDRFVRPLAHGEALGAWALTEAEAGSDAAALQTTVTSDGSSFYIKGAKTFITNGDVADFIVVFATKERPSDSNNRGGFGRFAMSRGISAFVLGRDAYGLQATAQHRKLGMRSSSTAELLFNDVPVSKQDMIGEEGRGFQYAMEILDSSRIIIAAQCVGISQAALEESVRYSKSPRSFGRPIGEQQGVQFMLADMATEVMAARLLTMQAATLKDKKMPFNAEASMAKLLASETAVRVTSRAVQIHGNEGLFKDATVARLLRDARLTTIYEGTSEIQRLAIARHILGRRPGMRS